MDRLKPSFFERNPVIFARELIGAHWLFNVLVKGDDESGFVLFRALEAVSGIEQMRGRREGAADRLLGAGPGRLTAKRTARVFSNSRIAESSAAKRWRPARAAASAFPGPPSFHGALAIRRRARSAGNSDSSRH
jgi:hypothetical protein